MMRMKLQLFATNSIVDLLKSHGKDSSYSARKELASSLGITNYSGTAAQNTMMAKALSASSGGANASAGVGGAKNAVSGGAKASAGLNAISSGAKGGGVSAITNSMNQQKPKNLPYTGSGNEVATNLPLSTNYTPTYTQLSAPQSNGVINGVDKATTDKMQSTFSESDKVKNAQKESESYLGNVKQLGSVTDIIDQSTWDALNQKWVQPQAITDAWNFTNGLLEQLTSGRTSYTDQIKDLMGQIQNRDKFSYDVDNDVLFQQYLASSMASGKTAMQDTMGQASALTGGYGSTYATSAANQQYNAYIQDAYNNLPEYYQMAMEAYQMEGDEMYKQLGMLNDADATEYSRMYNSWQANFNNANSMYERAYGEWGDSVNNAYNSANLQLNEHGQLFDQAYKTYMAVADNAQQMYQNEYTSWADQVNNAFRYGDLANSDYWNTTNFNEGVRQYNQNFGEEVRQFNSTMAQRQAEHNSEMAYKNRALAQDQNQFEAKQLQDNAQFNAKLVGDKGTAESTDITLKSPSESQMKKALEAYNTGGENALYQYVDSLSGDIDMDAIDSYISQYGQLPLESRTFTKTKNTTNWMWGTDNNDIVVDQYGNEYRIDALPESLRKALTKLKKNESYTAK